MLHSIRYWCLATGRVLDYDIYKASPLVERKAHYLSDDDREKLIRAADNTRDKALILTLLHCGLRNKEIRSLELQDVDLDNRLLHVRDHGEGIKNSVEAPVVISHRCATALREWLGDRPSCSVNVVFITVDYKKFSERGLEEVLYRLKRTAGVTGRVYPHLCHHDCLTRLAMDGTSESLIQLQSRHKDRRSLQAYIHPDINNLRLAIDKVMR